MGKLTRLSNRKIRLPITIKLFDNRGLIQSTRAYKKSKILNIAQVVSWQKAYLKVAYGDGFYNECICRNLSELKNYLRIFTECSLLKFIKNEGGLGERS